MLFDGTGLAEFAGRTTESDINGCQDEVAAGFASNVDVADLAQFADESGALVEASGDDWAMGEYAYSFVDVWNDGASHPYVAWIGCVLNHPGVSGVGFVLLAPDFAMN